MTFFWPPWTPSKCMMHRITGKTRIKKMKHQSDAKVHTFSYSTKAYCRQAGVYKFGARLVYTVSSRSARATQ